ncbi:MAG TPA: sigma-70 family RNA polymerase sigma factor [Vicinamibacteria bacterium]|nr:sigma-70 family RNA polymerase sigma factor [Vicinamibacteria bacterium]
MQAVADELVARARAGDEEAFSVLVQTHARDVFRLAFRITRNEDDAEDTVQETFLRAYRKLDAFESRASFSTWLYRVTANTAIDVLRRRRRTDERMAPLDDATPAVTASQEVLTFGRQVRDRIESALGSLSEMERTVFVLRHFQELSLAEISGSLDITVSATKQALFRAVRKMRKTLAPLVRTHS